MAISTKLEMRQSQSLIMTPQLMQAIKLLQMSNLDLVDYVEAELERNPLLEKSDVGDSDAGGPAGDGDTAGLSDQGSQGDESVATGR
jgi:RNA polymerase sigma-54 factor